MTRRLVRYLMAVILVTTGITVGTAAPALAVGACRNGHPTVSPCFDYSGGSYATADFYINRSPDASIYNYKLAMIVNGTQHMKVSTPTRITRTGRYCCWSHHVDGLPNRWQTGYTRVWIYTSWGELHMVVDSPTVSFYA